MLAVDSAAGRDDHGRAGSQRVRALTGMSWPVGGVPTLRWKSRGLKLVVVPAETDCSSSWPQPLKDLAERTSASR